MGVGAARRVPLFRAGTKVTEVQGQKLLETGEPLSSHRELQGAESSKGSALAPKEPCQQVLCVRH